MNTGDSSYCKVIAKTYTINKDTKTTIDIKLTAVDKNINVTNPGTIYSGSNSTKLTYPDIIIIDNYKFYGAKYKFVKK